jgi:recombination protein RecT
VAKQGEVGKAIGNSPEQKSLEVMIRGASKDFAQTLPSFMSPERLVGIALTSIRLNPELLKCTPQSFMGSLFVLAQLGLEPIAGRAYLLPFKNKRKQGNDWVIVPEVQALIGYKGLAELFYRHASTLSIEMQTVHEKDQFDYNYGTDSFIKHKPVLGERGPAVGYYAIAKMKSGGCVFRFMSRDECLEHGKKHSKTYDKDKKEFYLSSPWAKDPDAMCMKTVLIQLAKLLPLSVEIQHAISIDETSREYRKGIDNALDLPVTTNWEEPIDTTAAPVKENKPAEPVITSPLPKNILATIETCRKKLNNDEEFFAILGGLGCTVVEEIPNIDKANEFIREISKAYANR